MFVIHKSFGKILAILAIFFLSSCGTISKVYDAKNNQKTARIDFSKYDKIIVMDFDNKTNSPLYFNQNNTPITQDFADKIYYNLRSENNLADKKVIKTTSEKFVTKDNLIITGDLIKTDNGNDILRGIFGFAGRSYFDARINLIDGGSKKIIAQIDVNKASLAYGLFVAANQDLHYLVNKSADIVAQQIADLR